MNWHDRIAVNPDVLVGKPIIKGTRLAVELILDLLAAGQTCAQVCTSYPGLEPDDVLERQGQRVQPPCVRFCRTRRLC